MAPPRATLTGFDMKKYVAATGQPANDPWKRQYVSSLNQLNFSGQKLTVITAKHGDIRASSRGENDFVGCFQASGSRQ